MRWAGVCIVVVIVVAGCTGGSDGPETSKARCEHWVRLSASRPAVTGDDDGGADPSLGNERGLDHRLERSLRWCGSREWVALQLRYNPGVTRSFIAKIHVIVCQNRAVQAYSGCKYGKM